MTKAIGSIRSIIVLSAIAWLVCAPAAHAIESDQPSTLLGSLPETVMDRALLIEGSLANVSGVDAWQLLVNDSIVLALKPSKGGASVPLRVVVMLRYGDNAIAIDAVRERSGDSPLILQRWSTHIFADSGREPNRFAILIRGGSDAGADEDLQEFRSRLIGTGLPESNISLAGTRAALKSAIGEIRARSSSIDRLLIYFRGDGAISESDGQPLLHLSWETLVSDSWLPISELAREVNGLPPASFVLDVEFRRASPGGPESQMVGKPGESRSPNPDQRGLPWLQRMDLRNGMEMLLSNPFAAQPAGTLTHLLLSPMPGSPLGGCTTLAGAGQTQTSRGSSGNGAAPLLYFTSDVTLPSFCISQLNPPPPELRLSVTPYPYPDPLTILASVEAPLPPGIACSWAEAVVDGVVVRHNYMNESHDQQINKIIELVYLTQGRHVIELRVGMGSKVVTSGRTVFSVPSQPPAVQSQSDSIHAEIVRPTAPTSITSSDFFTIGFVVADEQADSVHYELRNNGVVIQRGIATSRKMGERLEILRRIPVSVGENNIVIEVRRENYIASAQSVVSKRTTRPLHAVLIGADQVPGLPQLKGVEADVESIRNLLLNYTELNPADLAVLKGSGATADAIRRAVAKPTITRVRYPMAQVEGDEMLFLYFSGYGTTLLDNLGKPTARCILAADFDPGSPRSCISTVDIDQSLDLWNSAIVVFDTSYDGLSGAVGQNGPSGRLFFSRTLRDYLSPDPEWRVAAGTDRADRVFLVASNTNSPAFESGSPPRGLFTSSLVEAIENRIAAASADSYRSISLFDAFDSARNKTLLKSYNNQAPLIKGSLSTPFYFSPRQSANLASEARVIVEGIRDDVQALRSVDLNETSRAAVLYDTLIALQPGDFEAEQGRARIFLYEGDLASADQLVSAGLAARNSASSDALARSGWLFLGSVVKMRRGDIPGALKDCEKANSLYPGQPLVLAQLAGLYLASREYDKSASVADNLLNQTTDRGDPLTDDEWGHVVMLGYLASRHSRSRAYSNLWLKQYMGSYAEKRSLPVELTRVVTGIVRSIARQSTRSSPITVQSPYFEQVASFFSRSHVDASALLSYNENNASRDPKQQQCSEFFAHFYGGMKFIADKSLARARAELEQAMKYDQKQYVEYWIAQNEHNRIQ